MEIAKAVFRGAYLHSENTLLRLRDALDEQHPVRRAIELLHQEHHMEGTT